MEDEKYYKIFDIPILLTTSNHCIDNIVNKIIKRKKTLFTFANANTLNIAFDNNKYKQTIKKTIVLNDGIGIDIAAKILYKNKFLENLNGTDFIPKLFLRLPSGTKLYFLGSVEKNIKIAQKRFIYDYPYLELVGVNNGYFKNNLDILISINVLKPDIILVGLGNPKQEFWIEENYKNIDAIIFIGVGAFFDFYSGEMRRAPTLIRKLRLEWFFRLLIEPKRLFKRYVFGNLIFIIRVLKQKYS